MWRCEEGSSGWSGIRGDSIKSNPETARAQVSSVNQDSTDSERPAQLETTEYWVWVLDSQLGMRQSGY